MESRKQFSSAIVKHMSLYYFCGTFSRVLSFWLRKRIIARGVSSRFVRSTMFPYPYPLCVLPVDVIILFILQFYLCYLKDIWKIAFDFLFSSLSLLLWPFYMENKATCAHMISRIIVSWNDLRNVISAKNAHNSNRSIVGWLVSHSKSLSLLVHFIE